MPSLNELIDDFDDGVIGTQWGGSYGDVSEVGGRGRILSDTGYPGFRTPPTYTLSGATVLAEVYPAAKGTSTGEVTSEMMLLSDGGTRITFIADTGAGVIKFFNSVGYYDPTGVTIPYDAVAMRWWKLRETAGTCYMETSPDGTTWTTRYQFPTPAWVGAGNTPFLFSTHRDNGTLTNYFEFDNVNVPPATTPQPTGYLLSETFDNGTPGTNITTAETVFDTITGNIPKYSADSAHGGGAMRVTAAAGEGSYGELTGPPATEIYVRFYVKPLEMYKYGGFYPVRLMNGGSTAASLRVAGYGKLQMYDASDSLVGPISPIGITTGQWARIEWHITGTTQQTRLFQGASLESNTPTWDSGPATWSGGTITGARIGQVDTGFSAKATDVLFDEYAANETEWVGPATTQPQAPQPTGYLLTETGWVPFTHRIIT